MIATKKKLAGGAIEQLSYEQRVKLYKSRIRQYTRSTPNEQGCLLWKKYCDNDGYAKMWYFGVQRQVSRILMSLYCDFNLSNHLLVLHSCDNPRCCNIHHLRIGTPHDNVDDRMKRHRQRNVCGEEHPSSKLQESDVRSIFRQYARGATMQALAEEYGTGLTVICNILNGKAWKHLKLNKPHLSEKIRSSKWDKLRGDACPFAKLDSSVVREIKEVKAREIGLTQQEIARRFGISGAHLSAILHGRYWRGV